MTDLYKINDIILQDDNQKKQVEIKVPYKTDTNNLFVVNLFIKAIQKALDKVNESVSLLSKVKNLDERNSEDLSLLIEFSNSLNLASKIIDEFQKGTSILYDNTPEVISLFKNLNNAFTIVKLRISMFLITKHIKYADEVIESLSVVLDLFKNMQNTIKDTNNTDEESINSETKA